MYSSSFSILSINCVLQCEREVNVSAQTLHNYCGYPVAHWLTRSLHKILSKLPPCAVKVVFFKFLKVLIHFSTTFLKKAITLCKGEDHFQSHHCPLSLPHRLKVTLILLLLDSAMNLPTGHGKKSEQTAAVLVAPIILSPLTISQTFGK